MQCVLDPTWSDERLMPGAAAQLMTLSSVIQRDIYRPTGQSRPDPRTSLASLRSITQARKKNFDISSANFLTLPFPSPPSTPSFPLEVGPLKIQLEGLEERCKLPLRRSPSGNRIWCISVLKSDIWLHQIY